MWWSQIKAKKIGISGTLSYFRKGEPGRKGEPIFERGNQKVEAHYVVSRIIPPIRLCIGLSQIVSVRRMLAPCRTNGFVKFSDSEEMWVDVRHVWFRLILLDACVTHHP